MLDGNGVMELPVAVEKLFIFVSLILKEGYKDRNV